MQLYHFGRTGKNPIRNLNAPVQLVHKAFSHLGVIVQQDHKRRLRRPDARIHRSTETVIVIQGDDAHLGKLFFHQLTAAILRPCLLYTSRCV